MCSSMLVFIAFTISFQEIRFIFLWQSFAAVLFIGICKMPESQMNTFVLKHISAFELKHGWERLCLFPTYNRRALRRRPTGDKIRLSGAYGGVTYPDRQVGKRK